MIICEECNINAATVHMTKIVNEEKTEFHLCEACAKKREDINWLSPFSIKDLFAGFLNPSDSPSYEEDYVSLSCDRCGLDYGSFKNTSRLGCENCYRVFKDEIRPILKKIQAGADEHRGKKPRLARTKKAQDELIDRFRLELESAIKLEAFEEAARLRDRIRELEDNKEEGET